MICACRTSTKVSMLVLCNLQKETKCRAAMQSCPSRLPSLLRSNKSARNLSPHKTQIKTQTHRQRLHPKLRPHYLQHRLLPRRKYGLPIPACSPTPRRGRRPLPPVRCPRLRSERRLPRHRQCRPLRLAHLRTYPTMPRNPRVPLRIHLGTRRP